MECKQRKSQLYQIYIPKNIDLELFFQASTMKFPQNVFGKKQTTKQNSLETEQANNNRNKKCTGQIMERSETLPVDPPLLHIASIPQMICVEKFVEINGNITEGNSHENTRNAPDDEDPGIEISQCVDSNSNLMKDVKEGLGSSELEDERSRSNSTVDDSGFNSSASECSDNYDNDDKLVESEVVTSNISLSLKVDSDSQLLGSNREPSILPNHSTANLKSSQNLAEAKHLSTDQLKKPSLSHNKADRNLTTLRDISSNVTPRRSHRRPRVRSGKDSNVLPGRSLHTFVKRDHFSLLDCFQQNGFIAFVACIVYTLTMVFVVGIVGTGVAFFKAAISTDSLDDLQDRIHDRRRRRTAMMVSSKSSP